MTAVKLDGRFAGVAKIVRFNRQFYVASVLGTALAVGLLAWHRLPLSVAMLVACGAVAMSFWTLSSLLVSWYVYDLAAVTRWAWVPALLPAAPRTWVNIHAGLDESTLALKTLFPGSEGSVIDIYDPSEMTEPSIARARRMYPATQPFVTGRFDRLPFPDGGRDDVFLLFAAHEVRPPGRRTQLLAETRRLLKDTGQVVLVEHLRDWPNFLAFGPGFLHFHSGRSWRRSIRDARLRIDSETTITPFVHCFFLRKLDEPATGERCA